MPATIEERVAYLEGKVEEHSRAWQDLKDLIVHVDGRILSLEQRINHLEQKFEQRFINLEQRIHEIDHRINQRIDRLFFFIIATLASAIGSLIAAIVSIVVR